jgi:hypothetical protein
MRINWRLAGIAFAITFIVLVNIVVWSFMSTPVNNFTRAAEMLPELEELKAETQSHAWGSPEHEAALDAQAAKAKEITDLCGGFGGVYDEVGRLVDVNAEEVRSLAKGHSK